MGIPTGLLVLLFPLKIPLWMGILYYFCFYFQAMLLYAKCDISLAPYFCLIHLFLMIVTWLWGISMLWILTKPVRYFARKSYVATLSLLVLFFDLWWTVHCLQIPLPSSLTLGLQYLSEKYAAVRSSTLNKDTRMAILPKEFEHSCSWETELAILRFWTLKQSCSILLEQLRLTALTETSCYHVKLDPSLKCLHSLPWFLL